jgi:hypothetical protein
LEYIQKANTDVEISEIGEENLQDLDDEGLDIADE